MFKFLFALVALLMFSPAAFADPPVVAYDVTPRDFQCDAELGETNVLRACYVPAGGVWGPVNPNAGGPSATHAYISFTLVAPQTVEVTFDVNFGLGPVGFYSPGIGIDGFDEAHLCNQFQGGLTNDNTNVNRMSLHSRAICIIALPAGAHTVYAMEYARAGTLAFPFRGKADQALILRK